MAEWLKAHAWKACVRETVPWVRIPLSPPVNRITRADLVPKAVAKAERRSDGPLFCLFVRAHRTAAQNCSVIAVVSSVTFQPFVSAFSLANLCSI
jgi:hypothetical protein